MSHDEGAPVDSGLEPGDGEEYLLFEAASSQPASTVPETADSSLAGLRVGDSSDAGPALSAPESAPASASAEQLAPASEAEPAPLRVTDWNAHRREEARAAWGESWTGPCGHAVHLSALSNAFLQKWRRHSTGFSENRLPNCHECRQLRNAPGAVSSTAVLTAAARPGPGEAARPAKRPRPTLQPAAPRPADEVASPARPYVPYVATSPAPVGRAPPASGHRDRASLGPVRGPQPLRAPPHDPPGAAAVPQERQLDLDPSSEPVLQLLPQRLPNSPRQRVAVILVGTATLPFDEIATHAWDLGIRSDGFFRHATAKDWVLLFEHNSTAFARHPAAWELVRSYALRPWFAAATVCLGAQADSLLDSATRRRIRRIWGTYRYTGWCTSDVANCCIKAKLDVEALVLSDEGSDYALVSIFADSPRRLSKAMRERLLGMFDDQGYAIETFDRGVYVSERFRPSSDSSSSD